jgi:hypothetical protein
MLINNFVCGDSVVIKVNCWQILLNKKVLILLVDGNCWPIIVYLFNVVIDMLAILIEHGQNEGQIKRVVLDLVDSGQSILQYVDDTILCMDYDLK